jgi:hypothetical protein
VIAHLASLNRDGQNRTFMLAATKVGFEPTYKDVQLQHFAAAEI